MNHQGKKPIAIVETQCSFFLTPFINALEQAGFWVLQSFDFKKSQAQPEYCTCTANYDCQCACELAVLLVYPKVGNPVTLVLDGREGKTSIFVTEEMEYQHPTLLTRIIEGAVEKSSI
jgi:hypothetical protein